MNQMEVAPDGRPWRDYLSGLIVHGVKLGLANIRQLMTLSGDPQTELTCLHLAGTNGKGSTAAFLDAMLRAAGYRTGKFTSPHLLDITERFQINGAPIGEEDLREQVEWFQGLAAGMDHAPTFFEVNTAIAFRWFARHKVDAAIIEVGMGGRFDATNVLDSPAVCAITNIDLDHTRYLGTTVEAIAFEKAGILKPGVPCVVGPCHPEALAIIQSQAQSLGAPLFSARDGYRYDTSGDPWRLRLDFQMAARQLREAPLALAGHHQGANAAVAAAMACLVANRLPGLTDTAIIEGLARAQWPCRLERVLDHPPVIIDVAHNPAGAQAIANMLPGAITIIAVSSDKDAAGMLAALAPGAGRLILTAYAGGRSMDAGQLGGLASQYPHEIAPDLSAAINRAILLSEGTRPVLIAGSVYAAGEARRLLIEEHNAPPPHF